MAQSCDDLRLDLLAIENQILNSNLSVCSDSNPNYCRAQDAPPEHPDNLSYGEVLQNYNKAQANLIISQGINAITNAMGGSHTSLRQISNEKIERAQDYMHLLETSLDKAEVIDAAMTPVDQNGFNTSFWHKHNFGRDMGMASFRNNLARSCQDNTTDQLCLTLREKAPELTEDNNLVQTLYGFAIAEMRVRPSLAADPTTFYSGYKERLKVRETNQVDSAQSTSLTPIEFRQRYFGEEGDLTELKQALRSYQQTGGSSAKADEIIQLASSLDPISFSYDVNPESSGTMEEQFNNNFSAAFRNLDVDLTDNFITDVYKANMNTSMDLIENDYKVYRRGLEEKAKSFANEYINDCTIVDPLECIKAKCGYTSGSGSCSDNRLRQLGVDSIISQINNLEGFANTTSLALSAQACFDQPTLATKKTCLENAKTALGEEYSEQDETQLKIALDDAKHNLARFNLSEPISNLQVQKALAINALEVKSCHNQADVLIINCQDDRSTIIEAEMLELGGALSDISIRMTRSQTNDALGLSRDSNQQREFVQNRTDFMNDCASSDQSDFTQSLCDYYNRDAEDRQRRINNSRTRRVSRSNRVRVWQEPLDEPQSMWASVGQGVFNGLVPLLPALATAWAEADYTDYVADLQIDAIRKQDEIFQNHQTFLAQNQRYSDVLMLNYGGDFIHNGHFYQSNFQATSGQDVYNPVTDPYSFEFAFPSVAQNTINTSGSTPTNTSTGNQTYQFSF